MRACERSRGFTLIEMMIVVAVVGILALLAVVGYRRWVRTAYMAEAQDMVSHIRGAEESFRAENSQYLDVSSQLDLGFLYPAPNGVPGSFKTAWGGPCPSCSLNNPDMWTALNVAPSAPVVFGYAVVADKGGAAPGGAVTAATSPMQTPPDLSALAGQPWYVVEAVADANGDGVCTRVLATSASNRLFVDREGE